MQVVDVKLGSEGDCAVTLESGMLKLVLSENTPGLSGGVTINVPLSYFLDALAVKADNAIVTGVVKVLDGVLAAIP